MDALLDRVWVSLDPAERDAAERDIARAAASELPLIGLLFYPAMAMVGGVLQNVRPPRAVSPVGRPSISWNAHEWEVRR